jgi:hypothetical protein
MKVDCCRLEYAPIQSQNQLSFPTCEPWAWMPWPSKSKQALAEIQSFQFKPSGLKQTFNCHFPGSLLKCNLKIRPKPLSITTRREDQALHHANRHFSMWSGQLAVYPQYLCSCCVGGWLSTSPKSYHPTEQNEADKTVCSFTVHSEFTGFSETLFNMLIPIAFCSGLSQPPNCRIFAAGVSLLCLQHPIVRGSNLQDGRRIVGKRKASWRWACSYSDGYPERNTTNVCQNSNDIVFSTTNSKFGLVVFTVRVQYPPNAVFPSWSFAMPHEFSKQPGKCQLGLYFVPLKRLRPFWSWEDKLSISYTRAQSSLGDIGPANVARGWLTAARVYSEVACGSSDVVSFCPKS